MSGLTPVLIAGPTASGKSALALALAERDGGCVINADALQVYACWRVLTARPDAADCARAPHRLYGHVACDARYSVGDWLRDAAPAIDAALARGQRPVIVGGAGLYFAALTDGLAAIPPVPPEIRARSDAMLRAGRLDAMLDDLARDDPVTLARIDRQNPARVQRAWDVLTASGRGLAAWHSGEVAPILSANRTVRLLLNVEIPLLNNRIKERFETMLQAGALDEAARFRASGGDLAAPAGRALGAAELVAYLEGGMTREAAVEAAVTATRRYAKRQRTWFRARMANWIRIDGQAPGALDRIPPL